MERFSQSVADTEQIANEIAATLQPGACIALHGDMGAGKTQFVRGLVRALGGDPREVSSPTYMLLHIYQTPRMPVFHLDAYRVAGADDFEQIGFEELLDQNGIVVVEWASRVANIIPKQHTRVDIERIDESNRKITFSAAF